MKKMALIAGFGLVGCSAGLLGAQASERPAPMAPDMVWPEVDAVFGAFSRPGSPGCSVGMAIGDSAIYRHGYGLAVVEWGIPNDPNTVYELGSVSKQFTAFSVLLLAKEGKLSLDDDIRKWLPEVPSYGKPITIGHLIHHTSGLRDYDPLLVYRGTRYHDVATNADILDMMARQKGLNFATGSQWQYSNTNYVFLAMIIERATGQRFREFAKTRIFEPLGMRSTLIRDDHTELIPRHAKGYQRPSETTLSVDVSDWEETGDGSVQSTANDLLKWMDNLRTGKVGGPDLARKMTETGRLDDGTPVTYAFGLTVDTWRGLERVQHGGSWAGYRSNVVRFPGPGLVVVTVCNDGTADPTALGLDVAAVVLKDRLPPATEAAAHSGTELGPLAGAYWSEEASQAVFVRVKGARVVVNRDGGPDGLPLREIGDRTFLLGDMVVNFPVAGGASRSFTTRTGNLPPVRYLRVASPDTAAAVLRRYVGRYRSSELRGAQWQVTSEGGGLVLKSAAATTSRPLRALVPDVFTSMMFDDPVVLRFVRSSSGIVTGFRISGFALQGLAFERER